MTRLAHITDLHFGAEDPAIVAALRDELNADPPDLIAVSGDLTQGARLSEFRAARAFLDSCTAPWLAVPGNHDISPYNLPERFFDPYRRWRRLISPDTAPRWRNDQIAVFGLNTARRLGPHWDWSKGSVTRHRLTELEAALDATPKHLARVVVMHHPLLAPKTLPDLPMAGGAKRALLSLANHHVVLVLAGHLHRGYSSPPGPPLVVQGATATSIRRRGEPNAYNLIDFSAGSPIITPRVWNGSAWFTPPP